MFVPTPGETRLVEIAPADIARHLVVGAAGPKLDPRIAYRVQAAVTMSGPFRENIKKLVERLDGGVAAVLMGFDGISVDSFAKSGYDGALPDIQTLAMEFAHLIAQARRTLQSLDAGPLEEFTLRAEIADAGRARADARVLPRLRGAADRQRRQGPIPDANDRAGAARGPLT